MGDKVISPTVVRRARKVLGWTQDRLAIELEKAPSTIRRWEKDGTEKSVGYTLAGVLFREGKLREATEILFSQDVFSEN